MTPDERSGTATAPRAPPRAEAFRYWLRLGCISFGGPAGQIALMHRELVDEKRWISERRFLHALNFCMVLPGPEATQLATYIGWLLHRTWGGVVAGTLFVLPSLVLLAALSWLYLVYGSVPAVAGIFHGIKPAVVAIVLHAAWRIGTRALKHPLLWLLAALAFVAIFALDAPFPAIVACAALAGAIGGRVVPRAFAHGGHGPDRAAAHAPAVIDDDTPTPPHARYSLAGLVRVLAACGTLWAAVLGTLALAFGAAGTLVTMGWFFTKAAFLTFGGAYAVLPYVYQGAVETYGWLGPTQMIDGLALGETTPGPLIMVVAFVGFLGGYAQPLLASPALSGALAATVVTFFTFLPSFLFILAFGPLIETTHGQVRYTAPLTAITAAVVGVVVNLAVFFAWHVFWPSGWQPSPLAATDVFAVVVAGAAALALFRFKAHVIPVIAACGAAGLLHALFVG
ncbi:MAG: chromate efflux transporter [Burkholderiales bacterium]